jgi:hypothetical protein
VLLILTIAFVVGKGDQNAQPESENSTRATEFDLKTRCAGYNAQIEARLTMAPTASMIKALESVFYSPAVNSCVVGYSIYQTDVASTQLFGTTYILEDVLTRELIFSVNTVKNENAQEEYQKRKAELKTQRSR